MPKTTFYYDDHCRFCVRTAKTIRALDWLGNTEQAPLSDLAIAYPNNTALLHKAQQALSLYNGQWHHGFAACLRLSLLLPVGWLFYPLLQLLAWTPFGEKFYAWLAERRYVFGRCNPADTDCAINK